MAKAKEFPFKSARRFTDAEVKAARQAIAETAARRFRFCLAVRVFSSLQRLSNSRTRSIGIASAVPKRDVTVVAWNSELYTASSVASSAASNSGDVASVGRTLRGCGAVSLKRLRISVAVENAIAKSPLPLL